MTGNYTFWIASDDKSELWLSTTNDNPVNKVKIASVPEWTDSRSGISSRAKSLSPSLCKQSELLCGGVAKGRRRWRQPCGGVGQAGPIDLRPSEVIPGSVLSPFSGGPAGGPTLTTLSPSSAAAGDLLYAHGERKQFREWFGGALEGSGSHHYLR